MLATFFGLAGPFCGLFAVCHERFLWMQAPGNMAREARILVIWHPDVNRNRHLGVLDSILLARL